ncbi:terminase large subunit [Notoacmeibacter sp. MSK16QG-6]|uniref:terminase large subunit n=1 Tax=Notoacmeibacter sp. MSK16QG-6 TaxID=2957982 RepID=UPI00209DE57B|nr:terminase TerL endonuclease subunit [Notoacmeibacter sp. MSK16QG-6]MCP1200064.1 terminase large subunit [Notoacmeibacter sp. MSK16QG-6]
MSLHVGTIDADAALQPVDLSCPDWLDRLRAGKLPVRDDLPLNDGEARRAAAVFNRLRLPDVPDQPTMADAAGPWARELIRIIFGSVTLSAEGTVKGRLIRKFFWLVPKKNAKTTNGAAIMLTALLLNRRPLAEFLLVGPTQEISDLAFAQAAGMIAADPEGYLQKRFHVQEHRKTIIDRTNKARLKIKTFDTKVMTGSKPVGVLIDEVHELGKLHYASKVLAQIRGGIIANPEGFIIYITTQSDEPPAGVFRTELDYARAIRDGEVKGDLLPILYEMPVSMQANKEKPWRDPENWPMVLPNLGRSITLPTLRAEFAEADKKGIEELSIWASQHLNIQIGIALSKDRWAGVQYWPGAVDPEPITVESLIERCEVIVAGGDGGGLDDLFGLCLCGRDAITKDWLFWFHAWAHKVVFERRKDIADALMGFANDGDLTICESGDQDFDEVAAILAQIYEAGLFPEEHGIGLDQVGVSGIIDAAEEAGVPSKLMSSVAQGFRLSGTIKGFERKLMDGSAWHDGSPLMTWCVGNAKTELRGNALLVTKQISGSAKIDPLIAGFNAFHLMSRHPVASGNAPSVYEERGISVL